MNQKTIKKYSSLKYARYREKYGLFLAEGRHVVDELLLSDYEIETIISSGARISDELKNKRSNLVIEHIGQTAISRIATTTTPQDILAVVRIPEPRGLDLALPDKIVIADKIKDPGNMGTIIRTAKAFGFDMVITTAGSVDIYNPKVIRSTQGAMFGIRMISELNDKSIIHRFGSSHKLYSLTPDGDNRIELIEPADRYALVIGTEIEGVSPVFLDNSQFKIRIPQSGKVDSLNAAVAAAIAMYIFSSKSKTHLS